jgi:uncharacterized membrane protein
LSIDPAVEATMPSLPGPGGEVMLAFAVLSALGVAMMVGSLLWRAPTWLLTALSILVLIVSRDVTPDISSALEPQAVWMQLLFVPGHTGVLQNLYPWVPWLFPMMAGLGLARLIRADSDVMPWGVAGRGVFFIVFFVIVRWFGADPHPPVDGLNGFLTVTKYPPSWPFLTLMLGINLLLLSALARWPARWLAPLEVFGRAPFFFYLGHLWIFSALSWFFPLGTSFGVMYLVWAAVTLALYPMCARYAQFKFSKPTTSMWRLF